MDAQLAITIGGAGLNVLLGVLVTLVFRALNDIKEQLRARRTELRETQEALQKQLDEHRGDIRDLRRDYKDMVSDMGLNYVQKGDHARAVLGQERKLDQILQRVEQTREALFQHVQQED